MATGSLAREVEDGAGGPHLLPRKSSTGGAYHTGVECVSSYRDSHRDVLVSLSKWGFTVTVPRGR